MKTPTKLGNLKFGVYFNVEDLLTWQAFGCLKAMAFLLALAASAAELAGSGAVAVRDKGPPPSLTEKSV